MKKLMFAAAVASALTGFSSVESANVVGYQNFDVALGVSKLTAPTFLKISGERKLGDFTLVSKSGAAFTPSTCYLNFYDTVGNQQLIKEVTWFAEKYGEAGILKERWYTGTGKISFGYNTSLGHWYLVNDTKTSYPMDDFPIKDGDGYLIKVTSGHEEGVALVYNGQVDDADTPVEVALGVSKLSGNVAPKQIKLNDIVLVSKSGADFTPSTCYLNFYDSVGNQRLIKEVTWFADKYGEAGILKERWYTGTGKISFGYNTSLGHWYLVNDTKTSYPMDDFPIDAGDGFLIKVTSGHTDGVQVLLPPAIEPTDK